MPGSLEQFGKDLTAAGLMTATELKTLVTGLPPGERPKDTAALSALLVQCGRLTAYQAREISQGRAASLVLGQYVVLDTIGAGGMGQVFKARHRRMERVVAIKLLPPSLNSDPAAVKRFQREVKAAAQLEHPNIVTAYDADEARGAHFLVMQYVEGSDLSALIKSSGPLPVNTAVHYILQAARGLAYAHGKGIVHRDIKPANLLVDREGTVKILDMGLARFDDAFAGPAVEDDLTQSGQMMGTVDYMAPEQAYDTHRADARADIYSLGCSLYRLLTGESVYGGDTVVQKILAHREQPIPSLCAKRPDVHERLDRLCRKMLAKNAADRHASMAEVVAELEALRSSSAFAAPTTAPSDPELSDFLNGLRQPADRSHHAPHDEMRAAVPKNSASQTRSAAPLATLEAPKHQDTQGSGVPDYATIPSQAALPLPQANRVTVRTIAHGPRLLLATALGGVLLLAGILVIIRNREGQEVGRHEVPEGGSAVIVDNKKPTPAKTPIAPPQPQGPAPALAKAPFDAAQAKAHQEAWAKHLGTTVETTNSVGMRMTLIPPGEFLMGSTDKQVEAALRAADELKADEPTKGRIRDSERPQHPVALAKPFLLGATEVTIGQFQKFSATGYQTEAEKAEVAAKTAPPQTPPPGQPVPAPPKPVQTYLNPGFAVTDDSPAAVITWNDAAACCNWLSEQENLEPCYRPDVDSWLVLEGKNGYRLPTEAEWEYACRGGTTTQYSFGDEVALLDRYGWYNANSGGRSHSVGTKLPNGFGLFDMHGNLYEWCGDFYDEKWYEKASPNDPNGPSAGSYRVIRGGRWPSHASNCRSAHRSNLSPSYRSNLYGFRVVRVW